jgi:hypothetical protein
MGALAGALIVRGMDQTIKDLKRLRWEAKEFFSGAPPVAQSQDRIHQGRDGFFVPIVRYPARFIDVIKRAHLEHDEILTDFETLERAWKAGGGGQELTIEFVAAQTFDPYTGKVVPATRDAPGPIDRKKFKERLPLLRQIYALIVEGDGSGKGKLAPSGFDAEPIADAPDRSSNMQGQAP